MRHGLVVDGLQLFFAELVALVAEVAADFGMAVLNQGLEVGLAEAQQDFADALLRARAAEGELGRRQVVDFKALQELGDDALGVEAVLDQS